MMPFFHVLYEYNNNKKNSIILSKTTKNTYFNWNIGIKEEENSINSKIKFIYPT